MKIFLSIQIINQMRDNYRLNFLLFVKGVSLDN